MGAKKHTHKEESTPRISSRHQVREAIKKSILSGKLAPETKLIQLDFAKKYNVTQNVVREALLELKACGLVETTDNKGFFVADLSLEKFMDFLIVRATLEGLTCSLCCDNITRTNLRELRELIEKIKNAALCKDVKNDIDLDKNFHEILLDIADNKALKQINQTFKSLMQIFSAKSNPEAIFREHTEILDAIESGDHTAAEKKARLHILNSKKRIEASLQKKSFKDILESYSYF